MMEKEGSCGSDSMNDESAAVPQSEILHHSNDPSLSSCHPSRVLDKRRSRRPQRQEEA